MLNICSSTASGRPESTMKSTEESDLRGTMFDLVQIEKEANTKKHKTVREPKFEREDDLFGGLDIQDDDERIRSNNFFEENDDNEDS